MTNIKIFKTNSIKINDQVIIYDVFYSNIKKCIAVLFNPCHICEDEVNKIKVYSNDNGSLNELTLKGSDIHHSRPCDYDHKSWSYTEINGLLYFDYQSENIVVKYDDISIDVKITNKANENESCKILLSTLVHEPCYHGIRYWIKYHRKLDINNYNLYLNDYSEENLNKILELTKDLDDVNINIVQWNFLYFPKLIDFKFHGAQVQSMNHALHYFNHKSLILTDVDEYLVTNNLMDIVNKYSDFAYLMIQNKWANRVNPKDNFGKNKINIYDSARDNQIIKNFIIDRHKIKVALVHGSFAYEGLKAHMLSLEECFFAHYLDYGHKQDRMIQQKLNKNNKRTIIIGR